MIDALVAIDQSISLVRRLRETWKKVGDAEMKNFFADLQNQLADAKLHIASLKEQVAAQAEEIRQLKAVADPTRETPTKYWGCYRFEGDTDLYCIRCWETQGKKSPTNRMDTKRRQCAVCQTIVYAG
jgi:hypothetical protein